VPIRSSSDADFADADVAATFARYPPRARAKLLALRRLILSSAERIDGVGAVVESLN
jgi:hypothetical protein